MTELDKIKDLLNFGEHELVIQLMKGFDYLLGELFMNLWDDGMYHKSPLYGYKRLSIRVDSLELADWEGLRADPNKKWKISWRPNILIPIPTQQYEFTPSQKQEAFNKYAEIYTKIYDK